MIPTRGNAYLAFTSNTDLERAKRRFREKFGVDPEHHFIENNILMIGPVPNQIHLQRRSIFTNNSQ